MFEGIDSSWVKKLERLEAVAVKRISEHDEFKNALKALQATLKAWCIPDGTYLAHDSDSQTSEVFISWHESKICLLMRDKSADILSDHIPLLQAGMSLREKFMSKWNWKRVMRDFIDAIYDSMVAQPRKTALGRTASGKLVPDPVRHLPRVFEALDRDALEFAELRLRRELPDYSVEDFYDASVILREYDLIGMADLHLACADGFRR